MNLLVTGAWKNAKEYLNRIEEIGNNIEFLQYETEELPCDYAWAEGVICNGLFLHHPIERFTHLKYIQLTSAGFDRVPMKYIKKQGITVRNARGVYSIPMAEWAVLSVLEIYKNSYLFFEKQQKRIWEKDVSLLELTNKTVCIVGYGSVGSEIAKRFTAFGTKNIAVNRSEVHDTNIQQWIPLEKIDEIFPEADIIILSIALTEETRNLIGKTRLGKMKEGSVIVNCSRGSVIDEKALCQYLRQGKFRGVALDVFCQEPLSKENELWRESGVLISPHNSFVGDKVQDRMYEVIYKNLAEWENRQEGATI